MKHNTAWTWLARIGHGGIAVLVATLVLSIGVTPASAAGLVAGPVNSRSTMASAYAMGSCSEEAGQPVCTFASVNVYEFDQETQVCVGITTYAAETGVPIRYEHGCASVPHEAFSVDNQLRSAMLAPITVSLANCASEVECTSSRDVTVAAMWTGSGELLKEQKTGKSNDGSCTYNYVSKRLYRQAGATITVDGQSFSVGQSMYDSASLETTTIHTSNPRCK